MKPPSKWGLKLIDITLGLLLIAIIVRVVAPNSGLGQVIQQVGHWLAIGVTYNAAAYLLNLL